MFHSRCHINDKLCPLLIDNGSCVNVASTRVVDKLGLKTTPHAKPYKLSWLKEEDIKVTQQVLINFSIGNFKDEVLCDVVPMEATHSLLGRPWQFDRKSFMMAMLTPMLSPSKARSSHSYLSHPIKQMRTQIK